MIGHYINSEFYSSRTLSARMMWHLCILAVLIFEGPGVVLDLDYHLCVVVILFPLLPIFPPLSSVWKI